MASNVLTFPSAQSDDSLLFDAMCADIREKGYSVQASAVPPALLQQLTGHVHAMSQAQFDAAAIGRRDERVKNEFVRTDAISWINGDTPAGQSWLDWSSALQQHLNRKLLLGLFSFESHFAHYAPGQFYKKHVDAFRGQANRVLSLVVYLNHDWQAADGGELVIYSPEEANHSDSELVRVVPGCGTIVAFLSEEFPHEVLPASRDRYSIAGWFRVNTSTANRVDPPR